MQTFMNHHVLKRSTLSPLMFPRLELYCGARVPAVVCSRGWTGDFENCLCGGTKCSQTCLGIQLALWNTIEWPESMYSQHVLAIFTPFFLLGRYRRGP